MKGSNTTASSSVFPVSEVFVGVSRHPDAAVSSISSTPSTTTPPLKDLSSLSVAESTPGKAGKEDDNDSNFRASALVEKELKVAVGIMGELERRELELERKDQELNKTEHELERRDQELNKRKHELERKEQELERKDQELNKTEHELERRDQELNKRKHELERKEQELERRDQELKKREHELERKEQELERGDQELNKREHELERKEQELERERRNQELNKREHELERKEHELERRDQEMNRSREATVVKKEESETRNMENKNNIDSNSNFIQHGEEHWLPVSVEVGEKEEVVEFVRKVMLILNKLTGRNLSSLLENFQSLEIVSEKQLLLCVKFVFEKAVCEPGGQAENCAKICKVMQMKKVQIEGDGGEGFVNFRKLLISMCQKEFEQDGLKDLELRFEKGIDISPDFCQEKEKLKKRSFATIQFVGEIYMENMLTTKIMHECIKKRLLAPDEDSLECLCKLLFVIHNKLDAETSRRLERGPQTGINDMSVYFKHMSKLAVQAKFSPSLMRMMQDVMQNC